MDKKKKHLYNCKNKNCNKNVHITYNGLCEKCYFSEDKKEK